MKKDWATLKGYEKVMKGAANARRIEILMLLTEHAELSLTDIARRVNGDFRTVGEHMRKLVLSGLISKKSDGNSMQHHITDLGRRILKFVRTL